jgi:hypothetical protein
MWKVLQYVKDFITFKGLDRVILLGNSLGGHIVCTILRCIQKSSGFYYYSSGLYESAMGDS